MTNDRSGSLQIIPSITGFLLIAAVWEISIRISNNPILIGISGILKAAIDLVTDPRQRYLINIQSSLSIAARGFLAAITFGIVLSIVVYNIPRLRMILEPVFNSIRNVAAVSLIPVFIVLFGIESAKVITIFWTAWPAIFFNALYGYSAVDRDIIDAAQVDGAGLWKIFFYMRFPLAIGNIITGLMIAISGGWISLVTAEAIGSNSGLGYAIIQSTQTFRYAEAYVYILTVAIIGYVSVKLISVFERND